jgi:hypothetical protein
MSSITAEVTYARLRVTDPARWLSVALAWRQMAGQAGRWAAEFAGHGTRLAEIWSGTAASAATAHLTRLRHGLDLFRLLCWEADQALSEFAASLTRARALLSRAVESARRAGLVIDDRGTVAASQRSFDPAAPLGSAYRAAADRAAVAEVATQLSAALRVAAAADSAAAGRLGELAGTGTAAPTPAGPLPTAAASPGEVRRWWDGLTPEQRRWLAVTEPAWLGSRDGVPAAYRDLANRLRLDAQRTGLDQAVQAAGGREQRRLRGLRDGLDALADRLADGDGPRAYLLGLDLAEEGRAVVALGDPDRAEHVLTHVPGMTADLASYGKELYRAERVAVRAGEIHPGAATSAVMWLDYDAPDFVDEAAARGRAEAGADGLRRFQDGLRASHGDGAAHLTVLGHSYGSLVVGTAATRPGLAADDVVFVGSPGVGVDSVAQLKVPADRVWSSTAASDAAQWVSVAPDSLAKDLTLSRALPLAGPLAAFGRPEDELWHGHNPSDAAFGARTFRSQADAGHSGYWETGRPALDALANITAGRPGSVPR